MRGKPIFMHLGLLLFSIACFSSPALAEKSSAGPVDSGRAFAALVGKRVRPDGGYAITIRSVNAEDKLDAIYANPDSLPFSRSEASRDGADTSVFFELVPGGYVPGGYAGP